MKRISQMFLASALSVLAIGTTIASRQNVEVSVRPPWYFVYTPCTTSDGQPGTMSTCVENGPRENPHCTPPVGRPTVPECLPNG